ncbi:hypothetical protein JTB14_027177 [Gonioctena quinquepunctata]|nr:hypothetical protein JTB14_027177 [Gonioctena quinquepunctata]
MAKEFSENDLMAKIISEKDTTTKGFLETGSLRKMITFLQEGGYLANSIKGRSMKKKLSDQLKITKVRERIRKAFDKNTKVYNLRKRDTKYKIGDYHYIIYILKKNYVLSKAENAFSAKLAPKFIPGIVDKVISPLVYSLKNKNGADLGNWHVKDLKSDPTFLDSDDDSETSQNLMKGYDLLVHL